MISLEDFQNKTKFKEIESSLNNLVKMKNFKNVDVLLIFNKSDLYKEDDFEKLYIENLYENGLKIFFFNF